MEKHILICGERGVGKSTLIRRLLAESTLPVGGFVTRRLPQADGDGMFPIYLHAAALPPEERPYDPEHLVSTCDSRRSIRYPEAFDRLGPPLLTSGGLLVMDELGFLENDAHRFQAAVLARWTAPRRCWPPLSPRTRTFSAGCGSILTERYLTSHRKAVRRSISICGVGSCNGTRRSYESDLCTAVL